MNSFKRLEKSHTNIFMENMNALEQQQKTEEEQTAGNNHTHD